MPRISFVLNLLETSKLICSDLSSRSQEAARVAKALTAVLNKLKVPEQVERISTSASTTGKTGVSEGSTSSHPMQPAKTFSDSIASTMASKSLSQEMSMQHQEVVSKVHLPSWRHEAELQPSNNNLRFTPVTIDTSPTIPEFEQFSQTLVDVDFVGGGTIDWTQLDQFTGFLSNDTYPEAFNSGAINMTYTPGGSGSMDYTDWESTPVYSLGARSRDPVTGKAVTTDS